MRPSTCRNVLYHSHDFNGESFAAMITEVNPIKGSQVDESDERGYLVGLHVMPPPKGGVVSGAFDKGSVPFSAEVKPGHWSWPPRV